MDASAPIHSSLEDDAAFTETIDAFVVALAERIDDLQDTELRGDMARLGERATKLGVEAERAGFSPLRRAADEVAAASSQSNAELAYKALLALTDLARRVRQGHRGSL